MRRANSERAQYVREHAELRIVFVTILVVGTFGLTQETLLPLMARHDFHGGARMYSIFALSLAVGTFAGALLATRRSQPSPRFFAASSAAFGILWIVAAVMPSVVSFVLVLPLLGVAQLSCITTANSMVQILVQPQMRGRVMALYMAALLGGAPIGAPLLGVISQALSPRAAMMVVGLLTVLGAVLGVLMYRARSAVLLGRNATGQSSRRAGAAAELRSDLTALLDDEIHRHHVGGQPMRWRAG